MLPLVFYKPTRRYNLLGGCIIKGYIQMIMKQTLGETSSEQNKALNVVLRNVERLDHLIQDILDISRLESGTMKFIPEKAKTISFLWLI